MSAFVTGDWNCPACGDHQFARNTQCRKCGTPRPAGEGGNQMAGATQMAGAGGMVSTNQQTPKAGDWICPNPQCQDLQFERNAACRRCGTPKPSAPVATGWNGTPRSQGAAGGGAFGGGFAQGAGASLAGMQGNGGLAPPSNSQGIKAGDWLCAACGDHQFAKNTACRNCGAPRPGDGGSMGGMGGMGGKGGKGGCMQAGGGAYAGLGGAGFMQLQAQAQGGNNQNMKEGDWLCTNCGDHQFAKNTQCRRCSAPKPAAGGFGGGGMGCYGGNGAGYGGYAAALGLQGGFGYGAAYGAAGGFGGDMMSGKGMTGGKGAGGNSVFAPGDWSCSQCGDHQFCRNETCRRCGAPKPTGTTVSSNKQAMKAGDWICPNPECNDLVFAKNDKCRKCGMARPEEEAGRARSRSPRH